MRFAVRYGYVPLMLAGGVAAAIALSGQPLSELWLALVIGVAILLSFGAERVLPYDEEWNAPNPLLGRDAIHAGVNETLALASVALVPVLAELRPWPGVWPTHLPLVLQAGLAVVIADWGITTVHLASHHVGWLWRLHAVHHSITRTYGFNGLLKHPLHQALETAAGSLPLLLLGVPPRVAAILAAAVAIQLLLQHSNVDYRVGLLSSVLALNQGHRFHHLKWAGVGDVNFGLFTLVWDHLYRTHTSDAARRFTSDDFGIGKQPDYPATYTRQLLEPFRLHMVRTTVASGRPIE